MLPLIPIIALGGVGVLVVTILTQKHKLSKGAVELIVLGMPGAGKTTWLNSLREIKCTDIAQTVDKERYEPFILTKENGEPIKVKAGYDIGGSQENVKRYYTELIGSHLEKKETKCVMFFFSLKDFIENKIIEGTSMSYQDDVIWRFGIVEQAMKKHHIDVRNFYLVISWIDAFDRSDERLKDVMKILKKNQLRRLMHHIFAINTTNKKDTNKLKEVLSLCNKEQ